MSYSRIFGISIVFSLLFLSLFVIVAFDSENNLKEAYQKYVEKDYNLARIHLLHEDNTIPLADFYLYESYIAREELGVKKSQEYLNQALRELETKKTSSSLEISLNSALNAYLQEDKFALQKALNQAKQSATKEEYSWIVFFEGCEAYLNKEFTKALEKWELSENKRWLSSWMYTAFCLNLSDRAFEKQKIHASLEIGLLNPVRERLTFLRNAYPLDDDYEVLKAFSYNKEAQMSSFCEKQIIYHLSHQILTQTQETNDWYIRLKPLIVNNLKSCCEDLLKNEQIDAFLSLKNHLVDLKANDELDSLSLVFAKKILFNEKEDLSLHSQDFFDNQVKEKLTSLIIEQIYSNEVPREKIISIHDKFLKDNACHHELIITAAFENLSQKIYENKDFNEEISESLSLCKKLESDETIQSHLAINIIQRAQKNWATYPQDAQKAIFWMQAAHELSSTEESSAEIEKAIQKTYRQAILQDKIEILPSILHAAITFHLNWKDIFDFTEIANQLADANYLVTSGRHKEAKDRAEWVLLLEPENQEALALLNELKI